MYKKALAHFKKNDPILHVAGLQFDIGDIEVSDKLFCDIARTIIGQQLSGKAADTIFFRFEKLFTSGQIVPEHISKLSDVELRGAGLSGAKVKALRSLADHTTEGSLDLERLPLLSDTEVIVELTKITGIGPWTAEMVLMFSLGRTDIFSMGDLVLKREIMNLHNWKKEPSDKKLKKVLSLWSPYKTYAAKILWKIAGRRKNK